MIAPLRVLASLLVVAAAALPVREVASPQAAPATAPCGPDFGSQLATILKLRDPGEPTVVEGGSAEEELRLSLALVINDYLMIAPKAQSEGRLPRSLQGLQPAQLRQWRDAGTLVPAVCEIVAFMHAHYSGVPFTPSSNVPLAPPPKSAPSAPEPRPAQAARAPSAKPAPAPVRPDSGTVSPGTAAESDTTESSAAEEPEPGPALAQTAPPPALLAPAPSAAVRRSTAQLEALLAVPAYPTLRDMRVQNMELTRKELVARRREALRARSELLDLLQRLAAARDEWASLRALLGPGGVIRVEQGIKRTFSGTAVALERDEALRLWRGEPELPR